ncbi:MAG TPA: multidrug effflux MFS transporter, partial [bacterium]|nr:multidrug effflux MFS transporter [bacterium]
ASLGCATGRVSLSLSSYFIGMGLGQILYGPFLDHFGRKRPLYVGILLYVASSVACVASPSLGALIAFRFLQALGGCAAGVAATAMVRDFFHVKESAKVFSLLMLILSVSPLLAPTVGGFVAQTLGWRWIFLILGAISLAILAVVFFFLPEGHKPDPKASLSLKKSLSNFAMILRHPQFYAYTLAGSLSFAGLFAYIAGSPVIFLEVYHVGTKAYGAIFALLAAGFIGGSQLNLWLLKRFSSEEVLRFAIAFQALTGCGVALFAWMGWLNLSGTIAFVFLVLACGGLVNPNAGALSLAPFGDHAGSAAALMGFIQITAGSLASALVGFLNAGTIFPTAAVMAGSSLAGLAAIVLVRPPKGRRRGRP